jgi:protoheme IX farnesyltransferase
VNLRRDHVAGGVFVALAGRVYRSGENARGERAARDLFSFSLLYLFLLFAALLAEAMGAGAGGFA